MDGEGDADGFAATIDLSSVTSSARKEKSGKLSLFGVLTAVSFRQDIS
jgi:hypothetical protein